MTKWYGPPLDSGRVSEVHVFRHKDIQEVCTFDDTMNLWRESNGKRCWRCNGPGESKIAQKKGYYHFKSKSWSVGVTVSWATERPTITIRLFRHVWVNSWPAWLTRLDDNRWI